MPVACSVCQQSNPDGSRFCQHCGNAVMATNVDKKTRAYATATSGGNGPPVADPYSPDPRQPAAFTGTPPGMLPGGSPSFVIPPPITPIQREQLILVMDVSGSMGEIFDGSITKLDAAARGGCNLVANKAQIDDQDEAGLVAFTDKGFLICPPRPLHSDKVNLIRHLQQLKIGGGTDLNEGLIVAERAFDWQRPPGVVRRIVMLTDGEGGEPLHTAQRLRDAGVVIDVIGVGPTPDNVNEPLLKQLASRLSGELHYRFIRDHQSLITHYTMLGQKTRLGTGG